MRHNKDNQPIEIFDHYEFWNLSQFGGCWIGIYKDTGWSGSRSVDTEVAETTEDCYESFRGVSDFRLV